MRSQSPRFVRTVVRLAGALLASALVVLTPTALVVLTPTPASAHNSLVAAAPDRDATLTTAPTRITLDFLAKLDPAFTTVTVTDANKQPVPSAAPAVTGKRVRVNFSQPLGNGGYTVAYRVVSTDGHPVRGSYRFTVAVPGASPAPVVPSSPASASSGVATATPTRSAPGVVSVPSASDEDGGTDTGVILGAGTLAVLLATAGALLWWRRRSTRE